METTRWRWSETDPLGRPVRCGNAEWRHVLTGHPELARHERAVRATIRDPVAIYDDPEHTARTRNPAATIQAYFGVRSAYVARTGDFVRVAVKWLPDGPGGTPVGYLATAYLTNRVRSQLQLVWRRSR